MFLNSVKVFTNIIPKSRAMSVMASTLKYNTYGEPSEVIKLCLEEVADPVDNEVLLKILVSPINPADINTIQGKYPVKPEFPAVGGNECVGEVIALGPNVKKLKEGDHVIPFTTGLGTWTSHAKYNENSLLKVPTDVGNVEAATITVNPCTAYRMIRDFVCLKPGNTIIQNGANSAVGQAVHQLCKAYNIQSVGVVRNRPEIDSLRKQLLNLGATEILTEEELRTTDIFKGKLKKPMLALNCVGGKSATEITRHLDSKGTMVTYGGMSREPVIASTAALIFKDISFKGFWMTRWTMENLDSEERKTMFRDLFQLIGDGKLKAPVHELVPAEKFKDALNSALNFNGFTGKKYILDFTHMAIP